jgi:hypothetical protein
LTILSAVATNVGVAVLIVTPDKATASPTKPRKPVIDWKKHRVGRPAQRPKV